MLFQELLKGLRDTLTSFLRLVRTSALLALPLSMKTIAERKSFMTKNKIKKTAKINLRVTPEEYISIKEKSKKASLSVSELIRRSLDDETIVEAPPVDFYEMIREIKRVGSNLDQSGFTQTQCCRDSTPPRTEKMC